MKPKPQRRWTPEEKTLLTELFPDTPLPEMAARLKRTEASVIGAAATMGFQRSQAYWDALKAKQAANVRANKPVRGRHWTEAEKAFILANPQLSRTDLMQHFGTTQRAVYRILSALRKQGLLPPAIKFKPKPKPKAPKRAVGRPAKAPKKKAVQV